MRHVPHLQTVSGARPSSSDLVNSMRRVVQRCWRVEPGSEAASVTITVGVQLDREGRVIDDIVYYITAEGGSDDAKTAAFFAARAILGCQGTGYDLPANRWEDWRVPSLTFDPVEMRVR